MVKIVDVAVIGGGVVGTSVAFHLKKLGCEKVLLLDRGPLCTGGTARSCAIIRSHYSIPTNTQLAVQSLEIFRHFSDYLGDGDADCGYVNASYLIIAPEGSTAENLGRNLKVQAASGANTFEITRKEAEERHPLLDLDDIAVIGFEPDSGYADPYGTTMGFAGAARRMGVEVWSNCGVEDLIATDSRVAGLRTAKGDVHAQAVVSAIGPWTGSLASWVGRELPLEVSRHIVLTFRSQAPYDVDLPVVKDMTTENKMYFRPASGGVVLVGTGDHGDPLTDPEHIDETVALDFVSHQGAQIAHRMPSFGQAEWVASWAGPYDITPDWNPVLGPLPGLDGLFLAYGFSGHGFKLAPAVGRVVAQAVLGQQTDVDIQGYDISRFSKGQLLEGSYGIGSIS
jgi:glycine/D-amino acid oxidase-like deaminating enzyme